MNNKDYKITNINIKGFKSINSDGQNIPLGAVNILIGANGVGKSNLISFFEMLKAITLGKFQNYIRANGGANAVLHYGIKKTNNINVELSLTENKLVRNYKFNLSYKSDDSLFFTSEEINWIDNSKNSKINSINNGLLESGFFIDFFEYLADETRNSIDFIKLFKSYQFNDTSKESKIRNSVYINDGRNLHSDAGNLAAFLYALKNNISNKKYYDRIVKYIKMAMPQFGDFELFPSINNENYIMLNWHEANSEYLFGPHQISDGSLRFMALTSLLLQPPKTLPSLIILDEPELGLHPSAISLLASMIKIASQNCQVIIATQSTTLIDEFEAKNIIIVERENNKSLFKKLNLKEMEDWLQQYSLSEIWEKNIIGGRP